MSLAEEITLLLRSLDGLVEGMASCDARAGLWTELQTHGLIHPFHAGAEDWRVGSALIRRAGWHAAGIPLPENVVGSWLLSQADAGWEPGRLTLADPAHTSLAFADGSVRGTLAQVPHASASTHLLAATEDAAGEPLIVLVEVLGAVASAGQNAAGEPRDTLKLQANPAQVCARGPAATALWWMGAQMRAAQMLGLAEWVLASSLEHVATREQFGRHLSAFQAVRHLLAELAGEVAASQMAVALADEGIAEHGLVGIEHAAAAIATARCQTAGLCETAIRVGHQLHGAMGYTREHGLHARTLRLMVCRSEFGYAQGHARWLGRRAMALGAGKLWPDVIGEPIEGV